MVKRTSLTDAESSRPRVQPLVRKARRVERKSPRAIPAKLDTLSPEETKRVLQDMQLYQIELELQNEELRQAQVALEASRASYVDLYDLAPVGYFTLSEQGLILEANLTGAMLLGSARAELVGQPFSRFVSAEHAESVYLGHRRVVETGVRQAYEVGLTRASGELFTAWVDATLAPSAGGGPSCRVVVTDITERKAIEDELRYNQRLLQTASRVALLVGWGIKLPSHALTWSGDVAAVLDLPRDATPSLPEVLALLSPAGREIIAVALRACGRDGTPFDLELQLVHAEGRVIHLRAIGQAARDAGGAIVGIEGAFQDITDQKSAAALQSSLTAQLRESQKMEAIGTLAGGIAHDFNNVLGTILGNAELARLDAGSNWQALVSLGEIEKAGHRGRDLVQQILAFSRRRPTLRRVLALAPIVDEATRLLRAGLSGALRIDSRVAPDTPRVLADATQIEQVLLNLGTNAAHAMSGRPGIMEISVDGVTLTDDATQMDPPLRPGRYARIAVTDTGCGMDAATRRRIFEPFFTTQPVGKGTGLGLAVVHGIVRGHDGAILVHSETGGGSRFEIYIPCANEAADLRQQPESANASAEGGGKRVVYIDDDEDQVFLMKRMLERWGYRVSAYVEQRAALDAVLDPVADFDLVITDHNMPGLSGLQVAPMIGAAHPALPVVLVSGYVTQELRDQAVAAGVCQLVEKARVVQDLRDVLQHLLSHPKVGGAEGN